MKNDINIKESLDKPNVQNPLREKNKRCSLDGCNKRLRLTDMPCKCGFRFCGRLTEYGVIINVHMIIKRMKG